MKINEVIDQNNRQSDKSYQKLDRVRSMHRYQDPQSDSEIDPNDSPYL